MNAITLLPDDAVGPLTSDKQLLKRGERLLEPDVYRAAIGGRAAVIKDYRRYRGTFLAPLARLLVRREAQMLRRLAGSPAGSMRRPWSGSSAAWHWAWNTSMARP